jgi:FlaA1/EpsC-like NDP-sugar epimerase
MELNPEDAVTNNVMGTQNVVEACEAIGVDHFVLISTDKAVNPANVMGATKLIGEMLVHDAAVRTNGAYVSVRFGNVLASSGSVVPLFQKQIAAGGPITVTHPDMTRYFMTIPEAVQLVLQAAAMGRGGETFILDMGEPVKIVDLASDLVQLSGYELGRDIDIVFTGLRPGEKLSEQLYTTGENVAHTEHEKIVVVRNGDKPAMPRERLAELLDAAKRGDHLRLRHLLAETVPGYSHTASGKSDAVSSAGIVAAGEASQKPAIKI